MKVKKQVITFNKNYDIEEIYDGDYTAPTIELLNSINDKSIIGYRTKTIKSGNILECEIYPVWNTKSALSRAKKANESRQAQIALNKKNALKHCMRLINTNFTDNDIWGTFTYETKKLPKSIEEAQKEMSKFIRRLKYYAERHNYPELKYIYVTEFENDEEKGKKRVHHHIVCNFPDRDIAEKLWRNGARTQTKRLQADINGYEGLARYILKDPKGKKRYVVSKNLEKPQITISDTKFSRKKVNAIVRGEVENSKVFESLYQNYRFNTLTTYTSDYCTGSYIYAKMRKRRQ